MYLYSNIEICVFEMKITKGHVFYLIFGLYLKSICKYNQIHIKLPTKGKAMPDINWLRSRQNVFYTWSVGRQH